MDLKRAMKRRAEETTDSLRHVFDEEARHVDPETASKISFQEVESTLAKTRRRLLPRLPETLEDFVTCLEDQQMGFETNFRGFAKVNDEVVGLIFFTNQLRSMIENAHEVQVDGKKFLVI